MEPEITRREALQTLTVGGVTVALSGCEVSVTDPGDGNRTDTPMQQATKQQPVSNGRFTVTIDDVEVTGFRHVKIPSHATQEADTDDGGDTDHQRTLWGQTTYDDLVMERNVIKGDATLRDWRDQVREGKMESARKTVSVVLKNEADETVVEWQFTNAWVKAYDPPALVTDGNEAATETCTVSFDEMIRTDS